MICITSDTDNYVIASLTIKKEKKTCSFKVVYSTEIATVIFLKSTELNVRKHLQRSHSLMKNVLIQQFHNSNGNIFCYLGFLSRIFTIHRTAEGGIRQAISVTLLYQFYLLRRHLNISLATTAESSSLHITNSWIRTRNIWFPRTSHWLTNMPSQL